MDRSERARVVRQGLAVGLATGAYGVSFGALGVAGGLTLWQTCALSALMFTGGSQFAYVGIVASGGSSIAATAAATLLGIRNGLYGLQVARFLQTGGVRRAAAAQVTIDESTAVALAQDTDPARRLGFWVTGASVFVFWNATTLAGAIVGNALGDPRRYGLDAAAVAAFCALLWPRLHSRDAAATAVLAALLTVAVAPWAPPGIPVLVAGLAAVAVGISGAGRRSSP